VAGGRKKKPSLPSLCISFAEMTQKKRNGMWGGKKAKQRNDKRGGGGNVAGGNEERGGKGVGRNLLDLKI
jgi:hypothetical protein